MLYPEIDTTERKLSLISDHAKRDKEMQFISLAHLLNAPFLRRCFYSLNRNKAPGHDGVSWYDYEKDLEENLVNLVTHLKRKSFRPKPARRVYIPKGDGKMRPLGISAIENKIVEKGLAVILGSIYEQDFFELSFGFRPRRNCHQALKKISDLIMFQPVNYIVEADIKGFFDNVSHEHMLNFLKIRIKDKSILHLIEKFLKAGYMDSGLLVETDTGTPQGSILSPLLANVFLHYVLDDWFENTVKQHAHGYCEIVRYADDFVCVVQTAKDAERIEKALYKRFKRFGLEIHPDKSRRMSFGRHEPNRAERENRKPNTFDFLGFTHYSDKTRKGTYKVGRKTSRKKFVAKLKDMNSWLKKARSQTKVKEWWNTLAAKLRGHYQYYGVSGNYRAVNEYYHCTRKMLYKWLNRRSQKLSMNWEGYNRYLVF